MIYPKDNFWKSFKLPLMMLAPMEDVTDTAFREVVLRNAASGSLHVVFTEFTSTDGLCHPQGRDSVRQRLWVSPSERKLLQEKDIKIVAQIWGNNPSNFYETAKLLSEEYDFDGIDINMGCPVRKVVAQGCGSALINNELLASEIITATREATELPVSVKTRLGVKNVDTDRWISFLLGQPVDGIILHGRIQKQMSEGLADWNEIAKAVKLKNKLAPHIPIIGNGDIWSLEQAQKMVGEYDTNGVMIGRGIFKNPWLFSRRTEKEISVQERINTLLLHLNLYEKKSRAREAYPVLKRFFKIYMSDFDGAAGLRQMLMQTNTIREAKKILNSYQEEILMA
ncbi:tRNA dihydrouridine synthase [Thermophagus sp. OGC60D27]|uniref:tRNA dihydrouridine synthase n=1 Tax=Thermophagus sp. OGC60D27 TaxID=3458415 RepID=UPI004037BAC6